MARLRDLARASIQAPAHLMQLVERIVLRRTGRIAPRDLDQAIDMFAQLGVVLVGWRAMS